jgi:DNA-binding response OmpR family regulator
MEILIIEDSFMFASYLSKVLAMDDHDVVGISCNVKSALGSLADKSCDAVILDINLNGESVLPVVDKMTELNLPFIVISGYDPQQFPAPLRGAPYLVKPFGADCLLEKMRDLESLTAS